MAVAGGSSQQAGAAIPAGLGGGRFHVGHILGATFFLAPGIAALAPLGLAPLFVAAAAAAGIIVIYNRSWQQTGLGLPVFGAAVVVWALLTGLWTVASNETWSFMPRFVLEVAGGICLIMIATRLTQGERMVFERLLIAGFVLGAILFAIEIVTDGGIAMTLRALILGQHRALELGELNRGAAVMAAFVFPAAIAIRRQYGLAACFALIVLATLLTVGVQGYKAGFGLAAGIAVVLAALALKRRVVTVVAIVLVAGIAVAPLYSSTLSAIPGPWTTSENPSVKHRVLIWKFVTHQIYQQPILGWGLNTSRAMPGGKEGPSVGTESLPLHPHNMPLQLWLELGGIGAMLAAAGLAVGVLRLRRRYAQVADLALALGAIGATALMATVGYGVWQTWWLATLWMIAASLMALGDTSNAED